MMTYDRQRAVAYAQQWAYGRNPLYYDFSGIGGDCTNFISQSLYAGCGVMNYTRNTGWYYNNLSDRAAAWTGVEFLYRFLTANQGAGPYAEERPIETAQPADVIQLSFNGVTFGHSLLVVAVSPAILIATHTNDAYNKPLYAYNFVKARLLHIEGTRNASVGS